MIALHRGFLETAGERIYWELADPAAGDGRTVVLTHGAGGNHASWWQQVPALCAAGYAVLIWDQRGFGRSTSATRSPGPRSAVADLAALLDGTATGGPRLPAGAVDLVGQSMGGWAVLGYAIEHPARVRSLVLADTIGGIFTASIRDAYESFLATAASRWREPTMLGRHAALGDGTDATLGFLYQQLSSFADPPMVEVGSALNATEASHDDLAHLELPVLFVAGAEDPIFPPAVIREAAALVPNARIVEIPGAGHSPYFETALAWNDAVLDFLRR